MTVSAHPDPPPARLPGHIVLRTTEEQDRVIRKAADLLGWTVAEYVLSAALDRAERDLYTDAVTREAEDIAPGRPYPDGVVGPFTALLGG